MTNSVTPRVDVIVPVHAATRPIRRLAASVLDATRANVRLTFVCHNVPVSDIAKALGGFFDNPAVRLLAFSDSTQSPAGPFNHGLDAATAPFVLKIDSDDTLESGAIDAWLAIQSRTQADIVIARMVVEETRAEFSTPPTRIGRRDHLDPVRDRLAYRTSTMGLIATDQFRLAPSVVGLQTGEDILPSLRLWFSGASIAIADREPAYLVHGGANDRVTAGVRSIADEFIWLDALLDNPWFNDLGDRSKRSIALKLIRVQLFGAVNNRLATDLWSPADRTELARAANALARLAGPALGAISIADAHLLSAIRHESEVSVLLARASDRRRFGHPSTLFPHRISAFFAREAPPRLVVAFWYATRRARRVRD
jgi:glycosyltransferase involved in cell wall biosynthesis